MKTLLRFWLLLALGSIAARAAVELAPVRIDESRSQVFHDDNVSRNPAELKVTFSLTGPEAESSIKYGDIRLEEVVDDTGASLIAPKDTFHDPAKFQEYDNAFFRKSSFGNRPPAAPEMVLRLALPKRAATRIARLRGSVRLADAGAVRTFELTSLVGVGKKTMAIPADAGVTISASVKAGNDRSVEIEIAGDENAVESVEIVGASGEKISGGMSTWTFNGLPPHRSLGLTRALDNSMKLVAKIATNRKVTIVNFDLKDIPLP